MNKKYFTYEISPYYNKYTIHLNFNSFPNISTNGSFNLIPARLLHLNYADYLRMCRDIYGAEIIGKKSKYPIAVFGEEQKVKELITELNFRMNIIMKNKE